MWEFFLVFGVGLIVGVCLTIAAIVTLLKYAMKRFRSPFRPKP